MYYYIIDIVKVKILSLSTDSLHVKNIKNKKFIFIIIFALKKKKWSNHQGFFVKKKNDVTCSRDVIEVPAAVLCATKWNAK